MSIDQGFCNIVTDGVYFYSSNTYERVIVRINKMGGKGAIEESFIKMDEEQSPLSLAIVDNKLYVYTIKNGKDRFGFILRYHLTTRKLIDAIPLASYSTFYPTMMVYQGDLFLSYDSGMILRITPDLFQYTYSTGIEGISGMAVALTTLYVSSVTKNAIYVVDGIIKEGALLVTEKFQLDSPRGLDSYGDSLYVCFGSQLKNCGLATYSVTNSVRTFLLTYFSYSVIPLNILYSGSLYLTMMNSNTLFRNSEIFSAASFIVVKNYNGVSITQSVVATNPACLQNPAYRGLINLRTVGSNPSNPIKPILTILERSTGSNIKFNIGLGTSFDSLQMRRKAETLQYRKNANDPGIVLSKKGQFKDVVVTGGSYNFSRAQLARLLEENNDAIPCSIGFNNGQPVLITPPSKSGIIDTQFEGYYLDPYVTYYPSL